MKILKYIFISLLCGFFFTLGSVLVVIYVLPKMSEFDSEAWHREQISEGESKIGMPCSELHLEAMKFTESTIGDLVGLGLEGGDWIAVIDDEQKQYIDGMEEKLYQCHLLEFQAKNIQEPWPEFQHLHDLFSALSSFSTRYGSKPVSAKNLKPEALWRVQFYYENVTSQGSKGASRRDAVTGAPA